jgi:T4 beta protein
VERPEFAGGDYSWGDAQILDCASGTQEPGSNNAWRGAGSSHHLRLVTEQLSA